MILVEIRTPQGAIDSQNLDGVPRIGDSIFCGTGESFGVRMILDVIWREDAPAIIMVDNMDPKNITCTLEGD